MALSDIQKFEHRSFKTCKKRNKNEINVFADYRDVFKCITIVIKH